MSGSKRRIACKDIHAKKLSISLLVHCGGECGWCARGTVASSEYLVNGPIVVFDGKVFNVQVKIIIL